MKNSIKSPQATRLFYSRPEIANGYDKQRFGGASGEWVNGREIENVLALIPTFNRALDLGCGTGRLTRMLAGRGPTVGADASFAMLQQAAKTSDASLAQADAFALPFAASSFDAIVALRVVFHFAQVEALLCEMGRLLQPGGSAVFDTYQWSPRALLPLDAARWGGGVYIHPPGQIERAALAAGLQVTARVTCFLFSPYVYRRLPLPVVRMLGRIEPGFPERLRARVFWRLTRVA